MEELKHKLAKGELKKVSNEAGKAAVWKHFEMIVSLTDEYTGSVQCKECNMILKYDSKKTGTSSLVRHIERGGCGRLGQSSQPRQLPLTALLPTPDRVPAKVKSAVLEQCVKFCCKDIRPFKTVAGEGFISLAQELINVGASYGRLPARALLPDPTTVSRAAKDLAGEKRTVLVQEISEIMASVNVGMTTDIWTDDYRKTSYMAITCHYVTNEFELQMRVLTTVAFPPDEAHTGENIRKQLQKQLISVMGFDATVFNKVVWVTDQGSNIKSALRPYIRLDCQDHVYNTVLKHALDHTELGVAAPEVAETLLAAKALVKYTKKSTLASQLSTTVKQMGDTRFSSVFLTLVSIKAVYGELKGKLDDRGESQRIDDVSPDVLGFLVDFLRPFYLAQKELEGDQYPTLNLVMLWHERLKRHCQPVSADLPHQAVIRQRHLEWIQKKVAIQPLHKLAMFLWPKFSQLRMMSAADRDSVHNDVKAQITSYSVIRQEPADSPFAESAGEGGEPQAKRRPAPVECEWENVTNGNEDVDEVARYLQLSDAPMENPRDVLGWWKAHQSTLPLLARLARSVLSIPASSSSSERSFSVAGRAVEKRRTSLKPDTVDSIIFLNNALKS